MAAVAVSCSLISRGCLNVHAMSSQSAVLRSSTCSGGSVSLAWDPLQRRQAMLRSRKSSYLSSSSSSSSSSIAFSHNLHETQRSSKLRLAVPRAKNTGDEELEGRTEVESEVRAQSNAVESVDTGKNTWSQFFTSAAKPAVVAVMVALMLAQPSEEAFAASSGGRMGGKAFSAPSRPAPSRSYSGGGGGGRGYSGGGGGVYAAPPIYGSPYGISPFGYSPFYGGGYGGGGLFLGPSIGFGGGGTIILAMVAFATLRAVIGFVRDRFRGDDDDRFDE